MKPKTAEVSAEVGQYGKTKQGHLTVKLPGAPDSQASNLARTALARMLKRAGASGGTGSSPGGNTSSAQADGPVRIGGRVAAVLAAAKSRLGGRGL